MNIYPINRAEAQNRHWVVRWLRYIGYLICISTTIAGIVFALKYASLILPPVPDGTAPLVALLVAILGGLLGLTAGLGVSLPYWAVSLALDDLHALRIYAGGYVTVNDERRANPPR